MRYAGDCRCSPALAQELVAQHRLAALVLALMSSSRMASRKETSFSRGGAPDSIYGQPVRVMRTTLLQGRRSRTPAEQAEAAIQRLLAIMLVALVGDISASLTAHGHSAAFRNAPVGLGHRNAPRVHAHALRAVDAGAFIHRHRRYCRPGRPRRVRPRRGWSL